MKQCMYQVLKCRLAHRTNQGKYASSKPRVIQLLGNPIHADNTVGAIKNRESTLVPSSRGKGMKAKYLKEV